MRIAVLASGAGSNLKALLDAQSRSILNPATIVCVLSNRPGAGAIDVARAASVPVAVVDHKTFDSRNAFEDAIGTQLAKYDVDAIVLAGFMRILTRTFVGRWTNLILNTHPSLLPAFPGSKAPQQAIDYGVRVTGCTVHFVDATVDGGPIIAQATVPVLDDDDATTLHNRIRIEEHKLLPAAVRKLASNQLKLVGRRIQSR